MQVNPESAEIEKPARKQRRGIETRRQLLEATKVLLADNGYQTITLDQVAQAVGVAKSSILWHFGSKEGLLTEAVYSLFDEIDAAIRLSKHAIPEFDARVEHLVETIAAYFSSHPEAKGIVLSLIFGADTPDAIRAHIREHWRDHVSKISEFLSAEDMPVSAEHAAALMALTHGCYVQWYLEGRPPGLRRRLLGAYRSFLDVAPKPAVPEHA